MARVRTARHPKPEPPPIEEESQEVPDPEPSFNLNAANDNGKPGISKAESVRQAMANGLNDIGDIEDFIKRQYGIEMPRPQISAYASQARARAKRGDGDPSPRRTRSAAPQQAMIPSGFVDDVISLRAVMAKVGGADALVEMLEGPLPKLSEKYTPGKLVELIRALG